MRKSLLLLFLLDAAIAAYGQTHLTVDMRHVSGPGPFYPTSTILFPLELQPEGYKKPQHLVFSRIRSFNFQPEQSLYWAYLNKKIDKAKFIGSLRGIDSTTLTKQVFENKLFILIGKDSAGNTIVVPDLNKDHSFSAEETIKFPRISELNEQLKAKRESPARGFNYSYFDGKKVSTKPATVTFNVYPGNVTMSSSSKDSLDKSIFLAVGIDGHRAGEFSNDGKNFKVALSNSPQSGGYRTNSSIFVFAEEPQDFNTQKNGAIPSKIGEHVIIKGNEFVIDSLSPSADKLYLTSLGYNPMAKGFSEGDFLPELFGRTIDHQPFDINQFKGRYIIIDFWGTWCAPCIEAMPKIKNIWQDNAHKGAVLVGIAYDDDPERVNQFVHAKNWNWTQVVQNKLSEGVEDDYINKLKITTFPTTLLIGRDGKILMRGKSPEELSALLDSLP